MNRWILCTACVLFVVALPLTAAVTWETFAEGVQIGRIKVPENRAAKSDRTITLAFARLSTTSATPRAPIVYLAGGPGQAAIPIARNQESREQFAALRAIADVILLDQRGIGESQAVRCKAALPPAPDSFTEAGRQRSVRFGMECLRELRESGVDISAYNTSESADDLEDLRRELNVPKLSLLGFSYGTHLGLAAIRRHGAILERVVLVGTEGPDHTWKLPGTYDTHVARLARFVAADPAVGKDVPDFDALLRRVASRFDAEPMTMRIRDIRAKSETDVTVDGAAFRTILIQDFGDASDLPYFPAMLHQLARGDTALFRWFVEKRWNGLGGRGAALYFAVDCASGVTASRRSRIETEARSSALRNEMNAGYAEVCGGMTALPDSFRAPVVSTVPTLFISGTLDANTPPMQAEEIRWGFTDSTHIVVENAGHEQTLPQPSVQRAIADFFAGKDVRGRTATAPPLKFVPVATKSRD